MRQPNRSLLICFPRYGGQNGQFGRASGSDTAIARGKRLVTVEGLCSRLGASVATIRRDLEDLEGRSLLKRTRGGGVPMGPLFYEPFRNDLLSRQGELVCGREASHCASRSRTRLQRTDCRAQRRHHGDGSGRSLKMLSGITIVTNTVNIAMELSSRKDIDVIVTGGYLRGNWFTLIGPLANQASEMVFADIMFLGVDGIHAEHGLTCTNAAEAELLRRLASHSTQRVVVCDRSKLGVLSKFRLCPTRDISRLITDTGASDEDVASFEKLGIQVSRV